MPWNTTAFIVRMRPRFQLVPSGAGMGSYRRGAQRWCQMTPAYLLHPPPSAAVCRELIPKGRAFIPHPVASSRPRSLPAGVSAGLGCPTGMRVARRLLPSHS